MPKPTPGYLYIRAVINTVATLIILAIASILVVLLIVLSAGRLENFVIQNVGSVLGRTVLRIAGIKLCLTDNSRLNGRQAVFISNHSSTLDLFILVGLGLPRIRYVAKYELQYNPFFWLLGNLTGQIFIRRQDSKRAVARLQQTYQRIKTKNLNLFLAPEGTRKHPGVVGQFKKGAFRMAMDLGCPIVPIFIKGARELCPGGSLLVYPGTVRVTIHPPIETQNWHLDTLDQHIEEIRRKYVQWEAELATRNSAGAP